MNVRHVTPIIVFGLAACAPESRDIASLLVLNDGVQNGPLHEDGFGGDVLAPLTLQGTVVDPESREPYSGPVFSDEGNWSGSLQDGLLDGDYEIDGGMTKGSYAQGRMSGTWQAVDEDGVLRWSGAFVDGLEEGLHEWFTEAGGPAATSGSFSRGSRCGEWLQLGSPETHPPCPNGAEDGPVETYHQNGQVKWTGSYAGGAIDGVWDSYHDNGQLQHRRSYASGVREGMSETYRADGSIEERGSYAGGLRDGVWESYHDNGRLRDQLSYVNGAWNGPSERYDPDGQLVSAGVIGPDGERCGEWVVGAETVTYPPCPNG